MKRFVICILLSFGSIFIAHCQTDEETALFNKINHHRDSLGLNKLIWDTSAYKMASHHAKYITIINSTPYNKGILTHRESVDNIDIPDFEEINTLDDRSKKFINKPYVYLAENCAILYKTKKSDEPKFILKKWLESKEGHKEIVESKRATRGACSIQYYEMEIISSSGKNIKFKTLISVLNIY